MRILKRFRPGVVTAERVAVLQRIGMSQEQVSARLTRLLDSAARTFERCAAPSAVFTRVSLAEFGRIYAGEGANADATPLEEVYPRADALAVFAGTLGHTMDEGIRRLFDRGDYALAYLLDVIAGCAAEQLAQLTANEFARAIGSGTNPQAVPYSPGYCGWHLSGQRALLEHVRPRDIGVELSSSYLMDPIKSVSGVLVVGSPNIHKFRPTYAFCASCGTKSCCTRMRAILGAGR